MYSQNSFETRPGGRKPMMGVQLPDSTYRIITNGKAHAPEMMKMETHWLDKNGIQIQRIGLAVPNCGDNFIFNRVFNNADGLIYVNGESTVCVNDAVSFLFVINANADSIKFIEYDSVNVYGNLIVSPTGIYYTKRYNGLTSPYDSLPMPMVHYNVHNNTKTYYTDSTIYVYGRYYQRCYISNGFIMQDFIDKAVCIYNNTSGVMQKKYWIDFDSSAIEITSTFVTTLQDIGILYRKFNPTDSQWTDAFTLLDSNLNVKWVHTIPNTTAKIQTAYPYKTQCVVRPDNTFLIIKHKDTEQYISRTLLLHHIDMGGTLFKVDTLQLLPPENAFSATLVLTSVVNTFDGGLFLTITQHFWDDYSMSPYLIKTDSNLKLPHRINTSAVSGIDNTSLNIFPNPNNTNQLHINFPEQSSSNENIEVTFYNAMGQQVKFLKGDAEELNEVDIEQLTKGCYVVEVRSGTNSIYRTKLLRSGGL